MAVPANTWKTNEDQRIDFDLSIDGETVSALAQIVIVLYYVRNEKKFKFSWHAIDPAETDIAAEAITENVTVHTITLNGEILEIEIPFTETDDLELEGCEEVTVQAEITYLDSGGKRRKVLDAENCDPCVGVMTEAVVDNGWL